MYKFKLAMLRRLHKPEDDGGTGGGGGDGGAADEAAKAAAAKAEADRVAAEKAKAGGVSDAEAKLLKENMQKKEALRLATEELNKAQAVLAQITELGGLDTIKSLVGEKKTAEQKQLEAKGEWDRLKTMMAEEHTKSITALKTASETTAAELSKALAQIDELTIGTSFGSSKYIQEDLTLTPSKARIVYGAHFELKDGKVVGFDKPKGSSERTVLIDGFGNPLPFEAALAKIVDADPEGDHVKRAKGKPGAGSESRKTPPAKTAANADGLSKIAAGLTGLGVKLNG